jgi:hypothetical protein
LDMLVFLRSQNCRYARAVLTVLVSALGQHWRVEKAAATLATLADALLRWRVDPIVVRHCVRLTGFREQFISLDAGREACGSMPSVLGKRCEA